MKSNISLLHPDFFAINAYKVLFLWKQQEDKEWNCFVKQPTFHLLKNKGSFQCYVLYFSLGMQTAGSLQVLRNLQPNQWLWLVCFQSVCLSSTSFSLLCALTSVIITRDFVTVYWKGVTNIYRLTMSDTTITDHQNLQLPSLMFSKFC